jgi:hypothetical protein
VFSGLSQPEVSYGANAIKTTAKGFRRVSFPDGTEIEAIYPFYFMRGALPIHPVPPIPHKLSAGVSFTKQLSYYKIYFITNLPPRICFFSLL